MGVIREKSAPCHQAGRHAAILNHGPRELSPRTPPSRCSVRVNSARAVRSSIPHYDTYEIIFEMKQRIAFDRARCTVCALLIALMCGAGWSIPAQAQSGDRAIPVNEQAELVFDQGLAAFERNDYDLAYRRFRLVNEYELNRKTTAALLMGGKALYRSGRYRDAVDVLQTLRRNYPSSSYADEAARVIDYARQGLNEYGNAPDTLRIGILLPLRDRDAPLTQALFNGIRLAVDEANGIERRLASGDSIPEFSAEQGSRAGSSSPTMGTGVLIADSTGDSTAYVPTLVDSMRTRPVVTVQAEQADRITKMYFRTVGDSLNAVRTAVDSLVRNDRVDVIIGPLYSREARAAGAVAEQDRVIMVAPLATDESVSQGRQYVFQTNPTIEVRGELMADFAARSLLVKSAGVIIEEGNSISERMAQGFIREARRQGLNVTFNRRLTNARQWSRLPSAMAADSLFSDSLFASTEAIYLPMSGRNAQGRIQDALTGLERMRTTARVLGNSQWHNLAIDQEASKFLATYSNDFYVDETLPPVRRFVRQYRLLTGETPDELSATAQRLAYTGYDVARFLIRNLDTSSGRPYESLRNARLYEGLGNRIDFEDSNVNRAMYYLRYRNNQVELLR